MSLQVRALFAGWLLFKMGFQGESEDGWCYKVEINRKLIIKDLDLPPESQLDPLETPGLFHVARLTH